MICCICRRINLFSPHLMVLKLYKHALFYLCFGILVCVNATGVILIHNFNIHWRLFGLFFLFRLFFIHVNVFTWNIGVDRRYVMLVRIIYRKLCYESIVNHKLACKKGWRVNLVLQHMYVPNDMDDSHVIPSFNSPESLCLVSHAVKGGENDKINVQFTVFTT